MMMVDPSGWLAPLDWPLWPFVTLYTWLTVGVLSAVIILRRASGPYRAPPDQALGLLEVAYLAGGPRRLADTVLLSLLAAGAVEADASRRRLITVTDAAAIPKLYAPFREGLRGSLPRRQFRAMMRRRAAAVRDPLIARGLAPRVPTVRLLQGGTAVLILGLLVFGIVRLMLGGGWSDLPAYILELLMLAVAGVALILLPRPPHRTWAGARLLARYRLGNARLLRAPMESEIPLAFALTGMAVMAGATYAEAMSASYYGDVLPGMGPDTGQGGGGHGSGCGGCGGGAF